MTLPHHAADGNERCHGPLPKIVVPLPDPSTLPSELKTGRHWLLWRAEWREKSDGSYRIEKVPCTGVGHACNAGKPGNWATLADALRAAELLRRSEPNFGVGLALPALPEVTVFDFDGDLADGVSDRLLAVLKGLKTFGERSISRTGAHVFVRAQHEGRTVVPDWRGSKVEVFGSRGFLAMTGDVLAGTYPRLADGRAFLAEVLASIPPPPPPPTPPEGGYTSRLDVAAWLDELGLAYKVKDKQTTDGRVVFQLAECPFDLAHAGKASVLQGRDGLLGFHCYHVDCADRHWKDFKEAVGRPKATHYDPPLGQNDRTARAPLHHHNGKPDLGSVPLTHSGFPGRWLDGLKTLKGVFVGHDDGPPPPPPSSSPPPPPPPPVSRQAWQVIRDYYRDRLDPSHRTGEAVYSRRLHREVGRQEATAGLPPDLIGLLAGSDNVPTANGSVCQEKLPGFFKRWGTTGWMALLQELPDEDAADLGTLADACETFRTLVRDALLTEFTLGWRKPTAWGVKEDVVERRPAIHWARHLAKPGRWRDVRDKQIYCKVVEHAGGELEVQVAIKHGLMGQLRADGRLTRLTQDAFNARCRRYGVGRSGRDQRACGQRVVILDREFVAELLEGVPDDPPGVDTVPPTDPPEVDTDPPRQHPPGGGVNFGPEQPPPDQGDSKLTS